MSDAVSTQERQRLCTVPVTLDGERARITGWANEYATVRLSGSGMGCEWAWPTVALVVARGGAFKS